jgi:hypothetical protein
MRRIVLRTVLSVIVGGVAYSCANQPTQQAQSAPAPTTSANVRSVAATLGTIKKNPAAATIYLYKAAGKCKGEVDVDPVGNLHDRHVVWVVVNENCDINDAYPKVTLEFAADANGKYPFGTQKVSSKRSGDLAIVQEKIKKSADVALGLFKYTVYLTNSSVSANEKVLDPDLEVEPPPQPEPANPAGVPPPKKQ